MRLFTVLAAISLAVGAMTGPAPAQDAYAPAIIVNDKVITQYELDQRIRFLTLLRAPGDVPALAEQLLIEDRLRLDAADDLGLTLTAEQVTAGMTEFAGRANLGLEEFLAAIAQGGVQPETYRDFVEAGLIWRDVVRAKFGETVSVTNAEVDRALANFKREDNSDKVLLSEIVLPLEGEDTADNPLLAKRLSQALSSESDFAGAAKKYSAAPSKGRGGRLEWTTIDSLPPEVAAVVRSMEKGQVSQPVNVTGAVALFFLRDTEEGGTLEGSPDSVEYATLLIPGAGTDAAQAEVQRLTDKVRTCDALYPIARKLPEGRFERKVAAAGAVPGDIAGEIARLDTNQSSARVERGGALVFVMVCARGGATGDLKSEPREQTANALVNQKLSAQSDLYLEELRAKAVIRKP